MDGATIAMVGGAMLLAAFVKGATGLGFSTTALPLLALSVGVEQALPLVIAPSLFSNLIVMREAGHFAEMARRFAWLYGGALIGVGLGLAILARIEAAAAGAALGAVLILYVGAVWTRPALRLEPGLERPLAPLVGFATGLVNGVTGSQVMPILPYLLALGLDPQRFVQAINISFTLSSLAMAIGLAGLGFMTAGVLALSLACVGPVWLGARAGAAMRRRLAPETFRRAVLILLGISGFTLISGLGW